MCVANCSLLVILLLRRYPTELIVPFERTPTHPINIKHIIFTKHLLTGVQAYLYWQCNQQWKCNPVLFPLFPPGILTTWLYDID